jgi:hypothetical protein
MKISAILIIFLSLIKPSLATPESNPNLTSCDLTLDIKLLEPTTDPSKYGVIRYDTISQSNLSIPSLWWPKERFDPFQGKLINNWLAYPAQKRIDLIVSRQQWALMNYLDRYSFVNSFGAIARDYNYSLRIFNQDQTCLAIYRFNNQIQPERWELIFDPGQEDGFQIQLNKK